MHSVRNTETKGRRAAGALASGLAESVGRVTHVVPALFSDSGVVGGAERYALELARHMADEVPTTLVTFGDAERVERYGGLRVRMIGAPWYVRGQRANPLAAALFGELMRADVVHCHQQRIVASTLAAAACRLTGRRVFVSDLGGGGWDLSSYVSTDRLYHGHLHISEYSRSIYGHDTFARAHVIMGGVDTEKFSPDASEARGGEALYVGRILPHKGVDVLVRAAGAGRPATVIGRPYDASYLETLRTLARGKPVTFLHDCDDDGIVAAYRRALCVVLPSVYKSVYASESAVPELLGQTLLEGMACGAPAICSDVASMPEVVEHGVTGFVVPPNDPSALAEKIDWLRDNPREAREMGEAARRRVLDRFTWPVVVRKCLDLYARGRAAHG